MTTTLEVAGLLVLLLVVSNFRRLLKIPIVRRAFRGFLEDVGQRALAAQPDAIRLAPRPGHQWKDPAAVGRLADPLIARGFTDLGAHAIDVMPQVMLRFLVNSAVSVYACVYEHQKAGIWLDLVSRYDDGSGATFTTLAPTGMDTRPEDTIVRAPGAASDALYGRMLVQRPQRAPIPLDAARVITLFEAAYAEQTRWRKARGISAREVGHVATAPPRA
jgi:hypothetical protein